MDEELRFQRFAHDKMIGGASPDVDSAPEVKKTRRASLAPSTFHSNTTDKSLSWELEEALRGIDRFLHE